MGSEWWSARNQIMDRQVTPAFNTNKDVDKAIRIIFQRTCSSMKLNLRISWRNLANMDYFSKTDAFVVWNFVRFFKNFKKFNINIMFRISHYKLLLQISFNYTIININLLEYFRISRRKLGWKRKNRDSAK